jgi:phage baseplate assembly protein W
MSLAPDSDFPGRGWAFPVHAEGGHIARAGAAEKIRQSILIILQTAQGERVMLPAFGCRINELVFGPGTATTCSLAELYVKRALDRWEPRIQLLQVTASVDPLQRNCLLIDMTYQVNQHNQPSNLVYPFYLNKAQE